MPKKKQPANRQQRAFAAGGDAPPKSRAGSLPPAHDGTPEGILKAVIADSLNIDADGIGPDTDLRADLGADSLDIHQLALDVEEQLELSIPDEYDLERLKTFNDWFTALGNPKELRRVARAEVDEGFDETLDPAEQDQDPGFTAFAQEESEL